MIKLSRIVEVNVAYLVLRLLEVKMQKTGIHQGVLQRAHRLISLDNYKTKQYNCNQDVFSNVHLRSFWGVNFHCRASSCGECPATIILKKLSKCFKKPPIEMLYWLSFNFCQRKLQSFWGFSILRKEGV